jgi:hypothetical protein
MVNGQWSINGQCSNSLLRLLLPLIDIPDSRSHLLQQQAI